ncbi:MAG TPA: hypothetical protein VK698_39470 [Kofleriaceae bacterium]|nr:hypothetical protein [Kofleriaceae bacterium]
MPDPIALMPPGVDLWLNAGERWIHIPAPPTPAEKALAILRPHLAWQPRYRPTP